MPRYDRSARTGPYEEITSRSSPSWRSAGFPGYSLWARRRRRRRSLFRCLHIAVVH